MPCHTGMGSQRASRSRHRADCHLERCTYKPQGCDRNVVLYKQDHNCHSAKAPPMANDAVCCGSANIDSPGGAAASAQARITVAMLARRC